MSKKHYSSLQPCKIYKLLIIKEDFMAFSYKKTKYDRHLGFCKMIFTLFQLYLKNIILIYSVVKIKNIKIIIDHATFSVAILNFVEYLMIIFLIKTICLKCIVVSYNLTKFYEL